MILSATAPAIVIVLILPSITAHSIHPRNALHPSQGVEKVATIVDIVIFKDTMNPWGNDIAEPTLCGLVDAGSKAVQAQMRWKVSIVIFRPV